MLQTIGFSIKKKSGNSSEVTNKDLTFPKEHGLKP